MNKTSLEITKNLKSSIWGLIIVLGLSYGEPALRAQIHEQRLETATSLSNRSLFSLNPASVENNRLKLGYAQSVVDRTIKVTHVNTSTGNTDLKFENKETYHMIGFSAALGGASAGIIGHMRSKEMESSNTDSTRAYRETLANREGLLRASFDLAPNLRLGAGYRLWKQEANILGSFSVSEADRTEYQGTMSGFTVGLVYENQQAGFGAAYVPAVRGKAKIEGEEKIISEPGIMSVDAYIKQNGIIYGVSGKKWIYKRDDRAVPSTSPVDQRNISLNGMDLEQFLFPRDQLMIGLDYPLAQNFMLGFNIQRTNSVFLYAHDLTPGDQESRERALHYFGAKLVAGYVNNDVDVRVGVDYMQRKRESIVDDEGWFGYWNYHDYKATDQTIFAAINLSL